VILSSMRNHPLPLFLMQQEEDLKKIDTKIYYTITLYNHDNHARRRVLFSKKQQTETYSAIYSVVMDFSPTEKLCDHRICQKSFHIGKKKLMISQMF